MNGKLPSRYLWISAIGHGLLIALLFVGSAFSRPPRPPEIPTAVLTFVPDKLVDRAVVSAPRGTPSRSPSTTFRHPTPPPSSRSPKPKSSKPSHTVRPKPTPSRHQSTHRTSPRARPSRRSPPPKPLSRKIRVNLRPTTRQIEPSKTSSPSPPPRRSEPSQAERLLQQTLSALEHRLATSSMSVTTPGAASVSYANYGLYVRMVYERAWHPPQHAKQSLATVKAEVVIARDGRVLSARILQPSGDPQLDRSVQETLDRVKSIGRPFPKGAKEKQRTFIINFKLRAVSTWG